MNEQRIPYDTYRLQRRDRLRRAGFLPGIEGNPDLLFKEDGSVKLPKLTGLAISMAAKSHGCLTRQPTLARAEAVMEALTERVAGRGMSMEIRPGKVTESFGVYLAARTAVAADPADTTR
jgi:hypothetical protein